MSLTFSEPLFFETLTVDENLRFPEIFLSLTYDRAWKDELITVLSIAPLLGSKISELSSGEKDRVNIIRALLYERPFLFLDEP
jgi:ABC-type multidrug transport system ATPase subunit